jgi:bifunctional non-homologous end joining protein LigD
MTDDDRETGAGPLDRYRRMRSGDRTAEPFGGKVEPQPPPTVGAPRLFVCQQHAARRMHWDLRLEIDGVLRSWAIPRGPSLDPAVKRMAVQTEDHPLEYVDFEGIIPEGNYGAGAMIVWDRGVWIPLEPVDTGYDKGKLLFELRGHKLHGVWTLVRTKEADGRGWLLIKKPDAAAHGPEPHDASILSGLTIEQLRSGPAALAEIRARLEQLQAPRREVDPATVGLGLAQVREGAFSDPAWLFELKYDGYRLLAARPDGRGYLRYRSGIDATAAFPEIARAMTTLPYASLVLDGEVVGLDEDARPNFQRLQKRAMLVRGRDIGRAMREHPVTLYAFDLLAVDGYDLRGLPLTERKQLLAKVLPQTGTIRYADHIEAQGEALMEQVRSLGLEGIVAKRADSTYPGQRSPAWLKIRIEQTDDFIVVGYTPPERTRVGLGALHLATYIHGRLTGVGRVGTGFSDAELSRLRTELDAIACDEPACPFALEGRSDVYVRPEVIVEVRYKHLTDDGMLRHPVYLRTRDDKAPRDCTLEVDEPEGNVERDTAAPVVAITPAPDVVRRVNISNPDKLFWPQDGYTKLDLIEYYRAVSPWLLPYLHQRPLVMTRYPDGIDGKNFFQKNAPPFIPDWLETETMYSEHAGREIEYFVCNEVDSLVYLANLATIPLHVWGSRIDDLQHPDWCILDLDPKDAPFSDVVRIARFLHELCDDIGLPNYCKTSGSTGLHVLIPLGGQCTHEQCRQLAEILTRVVTTELSGIATMERSMRARAGRVYVDWLQNGHGRLLVSPYSVRPKRGAPVSTPLRWDEVVEGLDHQQWTIRTVLPRLRARDPAAHDDGLRGILTDRPNLPAVLGKLLPRLS